MLFRSYYAEAVNGQPRLYRLEDTDYDPVVHNPNDPAEIAQKKAQALLKSQEAEGRLALGVYYKLDVPTYEDYLKAKIPGLREKPLAELDIYHRDITPNLQELM